MAIPVLIYNRDWEPSLFSTKIGTQSPLRRRDDETKLRDQANLPCYIFPVVKRHRFFNAFYICHVYSIEMVFDVDYTFTDQIVVIRNKVD